MAAGVEEAPPAKGPKPSAEPMETDQKQAQVDAAVEEAEASPAAAGNGFGLLPSVGHAAAAAAQEPQDTGAAAMEVDEGKGVQESHAEKTKKQGSKGGAAKGREGKGANKPPRGGGALTMADISQDSLTRLAGDTWSAAVLDSGEAPEFDSSLVDKIYREELGGGAQEPVPRRVALLELSQYLENYLWRGFQAESASVPHLLSIILMVNEKFKEGMPAWDCFASRPDDFSALISSLLLLRESHTLTHPERLAYLTFISNAFQSLENEMVRGRFLRLVGLPLWHSLSRGRLQLELHEHPQLAKHWKHLLKKEAKAQAAAAKSGADGAVPSSEASLEATFLPSLLADFQQQLAVAVSTDGHTLDRAAVRYCERFVVFLSGLLSQLPTRRFVHAVLEDKAVLVKCQVSALYRHPDGTRFFQLVEGLRSVLCFAIDDHSGDALTEDAVTAAHYERVQQLQRLLFKHWPKLKDAALSNCGSLAKREVLTELLRNLTPEELQLLVTAQLRLVDESDPSATDPAFLTEVMVSAYERRRPQREIIEAMPLYPTEELLLDGDAVPGDNTNGALGDGALALPRLNLQFLTLTDYLVRNFYLFRLEAAYEVREDVADALKRTAPYLGEDNAVHFGGWSRMAQPLERFAVVEVRKPKVGENTPAAVIAEITIEGRHMRPDIRSEWDSLKQHDVMFLMSLAPPDVPGQSIDWKGPRDVALKGAGLRYVRGCEVIEIKDEGEKRKKGRREILTYLSLLGTGCSSCTYIVYYNFPLMLPYLNILIIYALIFMYVSLTKTSFFSICLLQMAS